jgi:hypothetical protein
MKTLMHSIALIGIIIWVTGYFSMGLRGDFHFVLVVTVVAALTRLLMERRAERKKLQRH